jgi:hypothetical protein
MEFLNIGFKRLYIYVYHYIITYMTAEDLKYAILSIYLQI